MKLTEVQWYKVEQLQEQSFHGKEISTEELKLCSKAFEENPDRYKENGKVIKEKYKKSVRFT